MFKVILFCFLGLCALGVIGFVAMFSSMIFISPISDSKLRLLKPTKPLLDGIRIEEITENKWAKDTWSDEHYDNIRPYGEDNARVDNQGIVWPEVPFEDGKKTDSALIIKLDSAKQTLIAVNNKIYNLQAEGHTKKESIGQLGTLVGELDDKVKHVSLAKPVNEQTMVAEIYRADFEYAKVELIQINLLDFSYKTLTEKPTFTDDFPPTITPIDNGKAQLLVYFDDVLSWGFGGNVNRPKYQFVRLYNSAHPLGLDIAKISLLDGVIFRVWEDDGIIYYLTDPNTPSTKTPVPSRFWNLTIDSKLFTAEP